MDLERTIIHNAQTHHTIDDPNVADLDESGMKDANQENDDARIAELLQAEEYEAAAYQRNKCEIMWCSSLFGFDSKTKQPNTTIQ